MNENTETFELEALQKRDRAVFAQVMDQNSDRIYRLGLKMLGNVQDAEDILQETFIKAFNNIDQFEGRSKVFNLALQNCGQRISNVAAKA
ncbi:MAG: RNA polymerase sigma factor [Anaerolinea thermophila]|uniref:RNA polymerase sigma factor n=1 Tax=Anaerolinea thermophila TaxID=167964 RepID=A0A117LGJ7_9CHLR|nr:MAG: RNA polymerase sigma factor [Anaerolinea thermophila]